MLVAKLIKNQPFNLGNKIGDGSDGELFEFENNKIIKFSITPSSYLGYKLNILKFVKENSSDIFCKLYDYGFLESIESDLPLYKNCSIYFSIMEKLVPLSKNEIDSVRQVFYNENDISFNDLSREDLLSFLKDSDKSTKGKIKFLHKHLQLFSILQTDINIGNIMKNKKGYFKLIDFDRCKFKNKE